MAGEIVGITPGVGGGFTNGNDGEIVYDTSFVYRVKMDEVTANAIDVLQVAGLPTVNYSFINQGSITATCKSKTARQDKKARQYWEVTCGFDTAPRKSTDEDGSEDQQAGDPTAWTPRVSVKFEEMSEIVGKDISDTPYLNSAGDPFSTGFEIKRYLWVWEFTQYESAALDFETISGRVGATNGSTWRGYDAETWLCLIRNAELGVKNGYAAWKIDYTLKYNAENWKHKVLDVGPYHISGSDKIPFRDEDNNRIYGTLDGTGAEETTAADVAILSFTKYPTTDFSFIRVG